MKYTTIALPDNFEKGDCNSCPFCYKAYVGGEDGMMLRCVLGKSHNQCPIEIQEKDQCKDS